ncbi:MAG: HupE/UreJ family protein [Rubripirellula sp.]
MSEGDRLIKINARQLGTVTFVLGSLAVPSIAFAHEAGDVAGGFLSGLAHPVFGPDHVVAMIAVGLWGGQLGKPAMWLLPVTFPIVMAFGGMLGARGVPIPSVEIGIAFSAIVLGAMVTLAVKPSMWIAAVIVGMFAIFHGHAHGTELPESATPLAYGAGFVISTGLLHAAGIVIGLLVYWPIGEKLVRLLGAVIAGVGAFYLFTHLG